MEDLIKKAIEKEGQKFIDVIRILPETLPSGKVILWKEVDDGKVFISVDPHSARGGNPQPITINRFIPICELLFEGLGLRFGDGLKLQGGKMRVFGFSNINLEVHRHFLKFARECFGLEPSEFRVAITIPPKLANQIEEIEKKVSVELNISIENFFTTRILDRSNHPITNIRISSTLLGLILKEIFESLKEILLINKTFSAAFLRGVIASDANIDLRNGKKLDEISIAAKEESDRELIRRLLINLNIFPNKDKETIGQEASLIHGLSNFRKMKKWNLISLHPEKFKAFEFGINNFKKEEFRKGEGKFLTLKILAEEGPKRAIEIAKILNRAFTTILSESLMQLEKMNFVTKKRRSREVFWGITEEGLKILQEENPLEKLRSRKLKIVQ